MIPHSGFLRTCDGHPPPFRIPWSYFNKAHTGWPTAPFSALFREVLSLNSLDFHPSAPSPMPIPKAGMPVLPLATPSCLASAGSTPISPQGRCATSSSRPFDNSTAGACCSRWCVEHRPGWLSETQCLDSSRVGKRSLRAGPVPSPHPFFHLTMHVGGNHLTSVISAVGVVCEFLRARDGSHSL